VVYGIRAQNPKNRGLAVLVKNPMTPRERTGPTTHNVLFSTNGLAPIDDGFVRRYAKSSAKGK
jgi:hypothetical protein